MLSKQLRELIESAISNGEDITVIRNTATNGDDYYIKPKESLIVVYNSASLTQSLFLPAVGESKGKFLTIIFPDYGGGGTVKDQDDSLSTWSDLTNNADNEYGVFYNPGIGWVTLKTTM